MPIFLLIRHGENDYLKQGRLPGHLAGIHLNKHGREQAATLAETLKTLPIKAIYSSPLERAVETAEPLAQSLGLADPAPPRPFGCDVGEWQGMQLKKLHKLPFGNWCRSSHPGSAFRVGNRLWNYRSGWSRKLRPSAASTN